MAGVQIPVMALSEVPGKVKLAPLQIGATCVKVGVIELTPLPEAATVMELAPPPVTGIVPL